MFVVNCFAVAWRERQNKERENIFDCLRLLSGGMCIKGAVKVYNFLS